MSEEKSLSEWEQIFDNTEMYDEIEKSYKENFMQKQERKFTPQDQHIMQLGLLFQGWEESNNPEFDDSDSPAKQAWKNFGDTLHKIEDENMTAQYSPEAWNLTVAAFAGIKAIAKAICDEEPKVTITLTDYVQYKMFGDEYVIIKFSFTKPINISEKVCENILDFSRKFNTEIKFGGPNQEGNLGLSISLDMKGKLIYIKSPNKEN